MEDEDAQYALMVAALTLIIFISAVIFTVWFISNSNKRTGISKSKQYEYAANQSIYCESRRCRMREIKFRAWDKNQKRMLLRALPTFNGGIEWVGYLGHGGGYDCTSTEYELMQFTGIKDKNGREIYEGDIIIGTGYPYFDDGERNYIAVVEWDEYDSGFVPILRCVNNKKRGISSGCPHDWRDKFEVIGNIYENSELMEAK